MTILIYAAVAIAFLLSVACYLRTTHAPEPEESFRENRCPSNLGNRQWLELSERIFDPSDARWLTEELAFPKLAGDLTLSRKRLAIRWLQALRSSFDELVRTPELSLDEAPAAGSPDGWRMLWLTARFHLLIFWALLVVKVFGPYHRLIPSFSWVPLPLAGENGLRGAELADIRRSQ